MENERRVPTLEKGDPEHYLGNSFFYGLYFSHGMINIAVFYGTCDITDFSDKPVRDGFVDRIIDFEGGEDLESIELKLHPTDEVIFPSEDISFYLSKLPSDSPTHPYQCNDKEDNLVNAGGVYPSYEECVEVIRECARVYHLGYVRQLEDESANYAEEGIVETVVNFNKPYSAMPYDLTWYLQDNYMKPVSDSMLVGNISSVFGFNVELRDAFVGNPAEPVVNHLIINMTLGDLHLREDVQMLYCDLIATLQYDTSHDYRRAAGLWKEIVTNTLVHNK